MLGGVRGDEQLIRPLVRSDLHLRLGRGRHGDDRTSVAIALIAPARVETGRARTSPFGDGLDSPLQAEHRSDLVLGIEGVDVLQFVCLVGDVGRSRVQADQQVVNSLQVRAGVGDADRVRPLQRDHFALRTDQIFGLFGRLVGSDVLDSQHDVHQLVLPPLRQVRHLHMRNQVGRDRVVNVDDHQKLIATNKDITLLQQVAVDDVERLLRRVLLLVEIVERSRRDNIEVERQPGEFRKGLQDVGPRSVSKVEGHFFRLSRLGLGCFPFRRLIDGTLGRGSRESELVSRFPERHNRLARLVITCQQTSHGIGIFDRPAHSLSRLSIAAAGTRAGSWFRSGIPFSNRIGAFESRPLLALSVGQHCEPLVAELLGQLFALGSHLVEVSTTATFTHFFRHLAASLVVFFGDRLQLRDLLVTQLQIAGDIAVPQRADSTRLQRHLAITGELFRSEQLLEFGI